MHVEIQLPSWTALPDLPTERKSSASVHIPRLGDLVIGGCNSTRSLSNAELLKTEKIGEGTVFYWTEINPMIRPKSAPIAEYYDKRVHVFGVSFDMEMLSISSGVPRRWTLIIHHNLPLIWPRIQCVYSMEKFSYLVSSKQQSGLLDYFSNSEFHKPYFAIQLFIILH